jgi:transposase
MGAPTDPHDWREWRRIRALELRQQGWSRRDIATALCAAESAVGRWLTAARPGGREALTSRTGRRGVTPMLTPQAGAPDP